MVFLKDDGSLDIERINLLSLDEHMNMLAEFTSDQMEEYQSSLPKGGCDFPHNIIVDYTMEDEIKRGTGVDADTFLREMKEQYLQK